MATSKDDSPFESRNRFLVIYYFSRRRELNIIVLRPNILTISNIKKILKESLDEIEKDKGEGLYILKETDYRVFH